MSNISPVNKGVAARLREARIAAGYKTKVDAARAMGVKEPTYIAHESGREGSGRNAKHLELYAKFFRVELNWLKTGAGPREITDQKINKTSGQNQASHSKIPVLGVARAGHWLEVDALNQIDEPWKITVPADSTANRFGVLIRGRSMDRVLGDGDVAVCIEWSTVGREPQNGDILLVERHRAGMIETTVKRYKDGQLWGESNDPAWNKPIQFGGTKGEEIIIRGLVVSYMRTLVQHASNTPPPYMMLEE